MRRVIRKGWLPVGSLAERIINPRREGFKDALLAVGHCPGLHEEIRINRFGDPERETCLAGIRQGHFTTIN